MKDMCYSVRVESLIKYGKAYKVRTFDGSECFIPEQFVYERDWEVQKSEAYWISAWILEKKTIQYSRKKSAWFDRQTRRKLQTYIIERHVAEKMQPVESNEIEELRR